MPVFLQAERKIQDRVLRGPRGLGSKITPPV
jgi:hypothetical protein